MIGHCRSRLAGAIGEVRDRAALREEFDRLRNTGRLDCALGGAWLDPPQLSILTEHNPGSARRMLAMLRHLRVEARLDTADIRTIQTCLLCAARGTCERSRDPSDECPNSAAFRDLV